MKVNKSEIVITLSVSIIALLLGYVVVNQIITESNHFVTIGNHTYYQFDNGTVKQMDIICICVSLNPMNFAYIAIALIVITPVIIFPKIKGGTEK